MIAALAGALLSCMAAAAPPGPPRAVLVFTKAAAFRHDSIPDAVAAIRRLGLAGGYAVDVAADASAFTDANLARYDAVVFALTTGEVLDGAQEAALQRFIRAGGGFAGIHSASDTEHGSAWYRELVGAEFRSHPAVQRATLRPAERVHPSTRSLPAAWIRTDEWYDFVENPRGAVHVLITLDETTYSGGTMGADHPVAWCRFYDGGRTWYTALGHTRDSYAEPLFLEHLARRDPVRRRLSRLRRPGAARGRPAALIAILGPAPPDRGGIARETAILAATLRERVPVSWFTFSRRYPRWLDPRRFDVDPDLPAADATPVFDYRSPLSWKRTAEAIATVSPDALLVPWWTAFWGLPDRAVLRRVAALSPGTRRVLLCHNVEDHEGGAFRRFLALGAFLAADAFVVHAASDRDRLARLAPGRPSLVLPHPAVASAAPPREEARQRLGVTGPLVLFLGLVRRYKGVDLLLDAAPEIVRRTGASIAVVGEVFPDARDLSLRAASSPVRDRILWNDAYVSEDDMALWLAACDVVALPYRAISGSGIAARAFAAGRPVAAAAVGGLAETVEPGVTGELFAAGDAPALARAIETVLARGVGVYAPGLARAAQAASWPRYADALLAFLARPPR